MERKCEVCGNIFKTYPSRVRIGWGRFCSRKCKYLWLGKRNRIQVNLRPSPTLAYMLGVLEGDGCVYKVQSRRVISLCTIDERFAFSFYRALEELGLNPRKRLHGKYYWVEAISMNFFDWYKSLTLEKLGEYLKSQSMIIAFLRGFYESEGSYYYKWTRRLGRKYYYEAVSIGNTNKSLLKLIKRFLEEINFNFTWTEHKGLYQLRMYGKEKIKKFFKTITPCIKNSPSNPQIMRFHPRIRERQILKLTNKFKEARKLISKGLSITMATKKVGLSRSTYYDYVRRLR